MSNKVTITGGNAKHVNKVQDHLDAFLSSSKEYEIARKALDELAVKNVELANRPAHEDQYQSHIYKYKEAAEKLKGAAGKMEYSTDHKHIHKYFRVREN